MLALGLLLTAAIVVEDRVPLRASPHDGAPRQALLWRGDWLEVRGERAGFLRVWDHRHERPGYVRAFQARSYPLDEASAPSLRALMEFLREERGAESLGIGCAALYLRAAPPSAVGAGVFDALGTMADRLARRASARAAPIADGSLAGHLEVAASYGVRFATVERDGRAVTCYDGEAFRRVLALGGTAPERERAALGLTRPECAPSSAAVAARAWNEWRIEVLDRVDASALPAHLANRLRLRRAEVLAELVYQFARAARSDPPASAKETERAAAASERAVHELAQVERTELLDEEAPWYEQTAVRVAASRWAAEPIRPDGARRDRLALATAPGRPGETCVHLMAPSSAAPVAERCTYGVVWEASARRSPDGRALAVAVQPLAGWVELWLFHRDAPAGDWRLDTLTPAATDPDLGYVELAGFSTDGKRLLLAREVAKQGTIERRFQVVRADTLAVEIQARSSEKLVAFTRWAAADWRGRTLALR